MNADSMNGNDPSKDWPDHGNWCAIFVTYLFFGTATYAFIDLWLTL